MTARVVGVFLEYKNEFLILRRAPHKPEGKKWGLVAGKPDNGEDDLSAIVREVKEETGYIAAREAFQRLGSGTWTHDTGDFEFITYRLTLPERINITLNPVEHTAYQWITPEKCYKMEDAITGLHDLLESYYGMMR